MHEDTQRHCDEERGRADLRERFRSFTITAEFHGAGAFRTDYAPLYSLEDSRAQEKLIEADEQLKNRSGVPPLPTTRIVLFKP